MSTKLIGFLLEATLIWGALLVFYLLAFRGNGNWRVQRYYLLGSWTLGLVQPLLPPLFTLDPLVAPLARLPASLVDYVITSVPTGIPGTLPDTPPVPWPYYLLRIWQLGAVVALLASAIGLLRHLRPRPVCTQRFAGYRVVKSDGVASPYAAFRTIYLPRGLPTDLERTALLHEAAHLKNGHPYAQLWLLLGRCIFWFHPLAWVYNQLLSNVHEYEADETVARTVAHPHDYCRQLLRATLTSQLVPGLFSSPLKRRIMLLTTPSLGRHVGPVRYTVLGLLLIGLFFACTKEETEFDEAAWIANVDANLTDLPPRLSPEFSIGTMWHDLLDTIYHEVRYPEDARVKGLQGSVLLRMDIDKQGRASYAPVPATPRAAGVVSNDLPVTIVAYNDRATVKTAAGDEGAPFTKEIERIAERLSRIQWQPATRAGIPKEESIYLTFTFKLE